MNFLQLSQRLALEVGMSGSGPATTAGQTGGYSRVVTWVNNAWLEIQGLHEDWGWLRTSIAFSTVAGQASYPLGLAAGDVGIDPALFGTWDRDTFRNYLTSVGQQGEMFMDDIDYDKWRDSYMFGAMRFTTTRPVAIAVGPNKSLNLGPPPIVGYTITADYFLAPSLMVADTDVPTGLPNQFHMLIVYQAMMDYAGFESAPEVNQRGASGYGRLMRRLEKNRSPEVRMGGALA